jgi:hypothetical protein
MARQPSRLTIAKNDIFNLFDRSIQHVYSKAQLAGILAQNARTWRLAQRTTTDALVAFLEKQDKLRPIAFKSPNYDRETIRYAWGEASAYELALSLQPRGYLSHATAVALHGLTDLVPKTLYLNVEQSPKRAPVGPMTQRGIAQAFARPQRQSNMTYDYDGWSVVVINGKHTGGLGVEQVHGSSGETLRATNLERTLIDIAVRPAYGGGIFQVLEAYRSARERLSTNRLVATLKKLDYAYPYHQSIGFLMERAGYSERRFAMLRELGLKYDFYLVHGMQQPAHSSEWRLFFPSGFDT